ncbi:MAG TPA: peptidase S10 [Gammaproteobacteria bacterium]|nr:peptidase S10 [Gammaproteobacteria bacterium]
MKHSFVLLPLFLALASAPAFADEAPHKSGENAPASSATAPKPERSVTHGSVRVGGETIKYTATAGTVILKNDEDKPTGSMFYVAYTREGVSDPGKRPITFLYNGGPGSATLWLHMGSVGPVRVETADAAYTAPAPYKLVSNQYSLLDKTDLVFIDAMGTGFSRILDKDHGGVGTPKDFFGVDEDAKAFAQFIYDYVSHNDRWNSPKFLMGESYGTTRSAALVNYLQQHDNMDFNGVILVSAVLNFETISFNAGNDLPSVLFLPTYAATACYHKVVQCPADLPAYLRQVSDFATGAYADALLKGDKLPAPERAAVLSKLAQYTGLSQDYLSKAHLRVTLFHFMAELQRGRDLITGRLDSRFSGAAADQLAEWAFNDPQSDAISGAFVAAFNQYVRDTLKFGQGMTYKPSNGKANQGWNWKHGHDGFTDFGWPGYTNVAVDLADAMRYNPHLKVQFENGYYDLATPFFATDYTVDHLKLPQNLRGNISLKYYDAGHMMYVHLPALKQLHANLVQFYDQATHQ